MTLKTLIQPYFKSQTVVFLPEREMLLNSSTFVIQIPANLYIDSNNIRNLFEIQFPLGVINNIEQLVNLDSKNSIYQYIYLITFKHVFRKEALFATVFESLLINGCYDISIVLNQVLCNIRIFYDNSIERVMRNRYQHQSKKRTQSADYTDYQNYSEEYPILQTPTNSILANSTTFAIAPPSDTIDTTIDTTTDSATSSIDSKLDQLKTEILEQFKKELHQNYEQHESITEKDIDFLEKQNYELQKDLKATKTELDELKDTVKWMQKLLYNKITETKYDLRQDFKAYFDDVISKTTLSRNSNICRSERRR
jgi:hypothetical protein